MRLLKELRRANAAFRSENEVAQTLAEASLLLPGPGADELARSAIVAFDRASAAQDRVMAVLEAIHG